jgi:siroheme synthase (precorrin-2 oxidase/ferrochelatase)
MSQKFPEVQGGGSLIVAWQVKNKNVLVVGGGEVSRYHHAKIYIPSLAEPCQ